MALNIDHARVIIPVPADPEVKGFDAKVIFYNAQNQEVHQTPVRATELSFAQIPKIIMVLLEVVRVSLPELPHDADECTFCWLVKKEENSNPQEVSYLVTM